MQSVRRERLGRAAKRSASERPVERMKPIRRRIPTVNLLSEDEVERIHNASMEILEEVGIEFRDAIALKDWKTAGADVDGSRVRIDRHLLMELLERAPSAFQMGGRDPARDFTMGGDTVVFCPMKGAPYTRDITGVRRSTGEQDLINFARLTQALPSFHIGGGFVCEPMDIPVPHRHFAFNYHHLVETELPYFGIATSRERAEDSIAMAKIVHGAERMQEVATIAGHISGNSPLVWDQAMLDGLRVFAEAGQVVLCSPFVLGAANTPADVAATVAQLNAEAVAAIAYAQIVRPGARTIYGQYTVSISMQSGAPMAGTPEVALITTAVGQLARKYRLPWRTTGSHASSKSFDAQSGYESATSMMTGMNAGANLMLHCGGWDEGGLTICYAKFIADAEQNVLLGRYAEGISFDRFDEALAAVRRIGPGGHYLGDSFTLEHFRQAFSMPKEMDFSSYEQWMANGARDMAERCRAKAASLLREFVAPPIDPGVREELDEFVTKRKSAIDPRIM